MVFLLYKSSDRLIASTSNVFVDLPDAQPTLTAFTFKADAPNHGLVHPRLFTCQSLATRKAGEERVRNAGVFGLHPPILEPTGFFT